MTALRYARRALDDLEGLVDFLREDSLSDAVATYALVESALAMLTHHPLIGRTVESGFRELVISRGRTGYLALYRYDEAHDEVLVLAVRHQREAGYQQ